MKGTAQLGSGSSPRSPGSPRRSWPNPSPRWCGLGSSPKAGANGAASPLPTPPEEVSLAEAIRVVEGDRLISIVPSPHPLWGAEGLPPVGPSAAAGRGVPGGDDPGPGGRKEETVSELFDEERKRAWGGSQRSFARKSATLPSSGLTTRGSSCTSAISRFEVRTGRTWAPWR